MVGLVRLLLLLSLLFFAGSLWAQQNAPQGQIRIGIYPLEPINFFDNQGQAQGLTADLLKEIAAAEGWQAVFVPGSWDQGFNRLQAGEIDLLVSLAFTEERTSTIDYTYEPILELWGQVFVKPDAGIQSIGDLAGKRVGIMSVGVNGQNFINTARELGVECIYLSYESPQEVLAAAQQGEIDAAVSTQHYGLRYAGDYGLVPSSIQFSPFAIYFAAKKGRQHALLGQIDSYLARWKHDQNSFYYQRLAYWLGVRTPGRILPTWLLTSLSLVVGVAVLLFAMSLMLKTQVRRRTTELALKNSELVRSKERYRSLIDSMFQPMALHEIICAPDGQPIDYRYLEVNPAFEKLLGMPAVDIIGRTVRDLLPGVEDSWIDIYGRVALSGEPVHFENYSQALNKHFDIMAYSPQPRQFAVIVVDITERKMMREEKKRLEERILHAQKLESLGVLAGGIAHDFNNILMAVLGHCELALRRMAAESPARPNVEQIKITANKAADLANQMLAYSGKGKFIVEPLNLTRIVEEMQQMLAVSISKKVLLRYQLSEGLPSVDADATQLRQVVLNLVINASDAIGESSGGVSIATGVMACDQKYLQGIWGDENLAAGEYVFLEVADTGCGMDKETITRIFEPFFSTKFTGRGLGMAAVLGIVRGHKGVIKVTSEVARGTTFKVLLPASTKPAALSAQETVAEPLKGSGQVLLVDDDETIRSIGRELLEELGFSVKTAVDGREAVEIFRAQLGRIAFVLLDLTMPHMDGREAFQELRRIDPAIKVIISSGYNEQEISQQFTGKGIGGFLKKPYQLSALQKAIQSLDR